MTDESRVTVLAVDDNDILRYSIIRMLRDAGFKVIEARSGREALRLAEEVPDLITLDINLPDINGFEVCRELKANPLTSHIPVLHVSGVFVEAKYRAQGLQGGADAYLAHPFERAEFVATVEALLRIKSAEKLAMQKAEQANAAREQTRQANIALDARVKESTMEVQQKSEEIRRLNAHLMKLQDQERRKIARDLHDSTGQLLVLLNMNLTRLDNPTFGLSAAAHQLVNDCTQISSELSSQLRTVSYLLHPPMLDEIGLTSALEWYIQGFTERSKIDVRLDISRDFGRLPSEVEIAVFRIVQECLTNIHKHSGSKTASVEMTRDTRHFRLDVKDAGTKFAEANARIVAGTGLLGMAERVSQIGGELSVTAGPSGTHVKITAPVSEALQNSASVGSQG